GIQGMQITVDSARQAAGAGFEFPCASFPSQGNRESVGNDDPSHAGILAYFASGREKKILEKSPDLSPAESVAYFFLPLREPRA
ncbi:MAG TPA: hypothetical protein DF383_08660, partial [Deltaproteobacteria bacterium]|nr:hypothetical protein [Deltaproteobacteria bacterium]